MSKRDPLINIVVGMKGVGKTFAHNANNDPFVDPVPPDYGGEIDDGNGVEELPMEEVNENGVPVEKSVLKYVFCNYGGQLTVEDVHGNRVGELCGEMTLKKYREIERRTDPSITEFEGLEQYRCIVCKLNEEKEERIMNGEAEIDDEDWDNKHDPFAQPVKANTFPSPQKQPVISSVVSPNYNNTHKYNVPTKAPANPLIGEFFIDSTTGIPNVWDGNKWIEIVGGGGVLSGSPQQQQTQQQTQQQQRVINTPTGIPHIPQNVVTSTSYQKGHYKAVVTKTPVGSDVTILDGRTGQTTTFSTPFEVDNNWLDELFDKDLGK